MLFEKEGAEGESSSVAVVAAGVREETETRHRIKKFFQRALRTILKGERETAAGGKEGGSEQTKTAAGEFFLFFREASRVRNCTRAQRRRVRLACSWCSFFLFPLSVAVFSSSFFRVGRRPFLLFVSFFNFDFSLALLPLDFVFLLNPLTSLDAFLSSTTKPSFFSGKSASARLTTILQPTTNNNPNNKI